MSAYGFMEPRYSSEVVVRKLGPAELLRAEPERRCVRCGKRGPAEGSLFHEACKPTPAPAVLVTAEFGRRQTRVGGRMYDVGQRVSHLAAADHARVLAWLAEHGPATSRMCAWALELHPREVALLLRELDGTKVESAGFLATNSRGRPPVVWRVREAAAA